MANFTKKYHTWIFGILIFILLVITFLSGFQESRSEMLSEQKVPNIALTMHFVLYSLVSRGMIFAGLIDATKYNCCHQEIYNYLDNISMFVFGKEGFYFEKNLTKYIFYIKINSSLFQFL